MDSINLPSQNVPSDIREMARTPQLSWWEGGGIVSLAEKTGGPKANHFYRNDWVTIFRKGQLAN